MKYWHPNLPFGQHISVSTLVLNNKKNNDNLKFSLQLKDNGNFPFLAKQTCKFSSLWHHCKHSYTKGFKEPCRTPILVCEFLSFYVSRVWYSVIFSWNFITIINNMHINLSKWVSGVKCSVHNVFLEKSGIRSKPWYVKAK